jgi:hypothetical protein
MQGSTQYGKVTCPVVLFVICFTSSTAISFAREGLSARSLYYRESPLQTLQQTTPSKPRHLGVRYNLIAVDPKTGNVTPADDTRLFRRGECVALNIESNEQGYLYTLGQGSSGAWQSLQPDTNLLIPGVAVRIPKKDCLKIVGPAGTERIFVVLSRTRLNGEVARLRRELFRSDLQSERTSGVRGGTEPPRSTFVVAGDQSDRVVTEIVLRHD